MPLYEYACGACGEFSAARAMSESSSPARCPGCGAEAPRILSATAVVGPGRGRRRRGASEPKLVERDRSRPPARRRPVASDHGRPWMLGH